jgi:MFS family permease
LRQAFWAPYKRLARLINEQLQSIAASKAKASEDRIDGVATNVGKSVNMPPHAAAQASPKVAPTPFDVAKFAGIFAAIGLAVGALGTALASIVAGLFALKWWQIPIAFAGLLLLVSGPAVIVAWFKLRSRNLGPILDANGWAINARARINIPFGTSLTQLAVLPPNAERSLSDPYDEKKRPWMFYVVLIAMVALCAICWSFGWIKL